MRYYKLEKNMLNPFLESLIKNYEVYAPVKTYHGHAFKKITNPNLIDLNYVRTIVPPKKFFIPPKEPLMKFKLAQNLDPRTEEQVSRGNRVIFGIHPCDIKALEIMDNFYLKLPWIDPYYLKRRKNAVIIGHSCIPDDKCYCNLTGNETVTTGFDIFFYDLGDVYLIVTNTEKGEQLIIDNMRFFKVEILEDDIAKLAFWIKERKKLFKHDIDLRTAGELIDLRYDDPLWDEFGDKCLSCGSCSMVCPTCSCYNVIDFMSMNDEKTVERVRLWDSCMFEEYSLVAGGENFRKSRSSRIKLYYTHKLKAFYGNDGKPACVGCGRCVQACPANINVLTIAKRLLEVKENAK